jgi:hypothetical protein
MSTRHNTSSAIIGKVIGEERTSETPEQAIGESLGTKLSGEDREMAATDDMSGLELKLKGLEKEKSKLDLCRSRVDEDIKALKRAMQLVAMKDFELALECERI